MSGRADRRLDDHSDDDSNNVMAAMHNWQRG